VSEIILITRYWFLIRVGQSRERRHPAGNYLPPGWRRSVVAAQDAGL